MHNDEENARRDWRISDALWERIAPLLPARKPHPLGCHRPRVDERNWWHMMACRGLTGSGWRWTGR
jgi:transposase